LFDRRTWKRVRFGDVGPLVCHRQLVPAGWVKAYKVITDDLSEQDRDDLAKRAAKMAVLVKNPERVRAVVEQIVRHYRSCPSPTLKSRRGSARGYYKLGTGKKSKLT